MMSGSTAKKLSRKSTFSTPITTNYGSTRSLSFSKDNLDESSPVHISKTPTGGKHSRSASLCKIGNTKVMCRVRPMTIAETKAGVLDCTRIRDGKSITIKVDMTAESPGAPKLYNLNQVFDGSTSQQQVYEAVGKPILEAVFDGYNGAIIAYGSTSSGKTYTMFGDEKTKSHGVLPRVVMDFFTHMSESSEHSKMSMTVSAIEINTEKIFDLLSSEKKILKIRDDRIRGACLDDLTEVPIKKKENIFEILPRIDAGRNGHNASGKSSDPSKSHVIVIVNIQQTDPRDSSKKIGKLMLVDLAGSEASNQNDRTLGNKQACQEAKAARQSLQALRRVVNNLTTQKKQTYSLNRDSVLTRLLKEPFGGNCKTCLLITCSPSSANEQETVEALKFGSQTKFVRNNAVLNREPTVTELQNVITQAQRDIDKKDKKIHRLEDLLKEQGLLSQIGDEFNDDDSIDLNNRSERGSHDVNAFLDDEEDSGSIILHDDRHLNRCDSNILQHYDPNQEEVDDHKENKLEVILEDATYKDQIMNEKEEKASKLICSLQEEIEAMREDNIALANRSKMLGFKVAGMQTALTEKNNQLKLTNNINADYENLRQKYDHLAEQLRSRNEDQNKLSNFSLSRSIDTEISRDVFNIDETFIRNTYFKLEDVKTGLIDSLMQRYKIVDFDELSKLVNLYIDRAETIYQDSEKENLEEAMNNRHKAEIESLKAKYEAEKSDLQKRLNDEAKKVFKMEIELKASKTKYKTLNDEIQHQKLKISNRLTKIQMKEEEIVGIVENDVQHLKKKVDVLKHSRTPSAKTIPNNLLLKSPTFEQAVRLAKLEHSQSNNKENLHNQTTSDIKSSDKYIAYKAAKNSSIGKKSQTLDLSGGTLTPDRQFLHADLKNLPKQQLRFNGEPLSNGK